MKLLWWGALILLVMWALRSKKPPAAPRRDRPADGPGEKMVQCARCDVFIPASEALVGSGGVTFCCDEHRRNA